MSDSITITGIVATDPKHLITTAGLAITSFRLASPQRRFDRQKSEWVDGDTNWYTVTTFRRLAVNCAGSLSKGQRILVAGRLRIRDWSHDGRTGTSMEIDAEALGHDLSWGTAAFTRTALAGGAADAAPTDAAAPPAAHDADDAGSAPSSADAPADEYDEPRLASALA